MSVVKNDVNKNSSARQTKQNRLMLASNCAICCTKKSRFIENLEASRLLSKLGIWIPLSNIALTGDISF